MNNELKNTVEAADAKAQYDECAKRLLGQKSILSYIFAHTIEAFQGMKPKEIIPYIEGEPYIGEVPVEPGLTNIAREQNGQRVTGLNTENREIHEGMAKFDVVTYACLPPEDTVPEDKQTTVIVDVEAQKKDPSEYKILNRAVFYVGRLLSFEKGVNYMCNLGEGIEERALERGITKGIAVGEARGIAVGEAILVKTMNKNGFTAEQIAAATDKDVKEVEAILAGGELVFA